MTNKELAAARVTLRDAFERYYDTSELKPRTIEKYRHLMNAWERHTCNPPVAEINDAVVDGFRKSCLATKLAPATINTQWSDIRAVLRRLSTKDSHNPRGLGIINEVPWMRPVKRRRKRPRRIPLDDLTKFYVACKHAQNPTRTGLPPTEWWRLLIVMAYATALRHSDLLSIQWDDVDWQTKSLAIDPSKTGKADWLPLSDWAIAHLERARRPGETVFECPGYKRGSHYFRAWKELIHNAGVAHFTLHDIRRTAASEVDRIDRGMGKVLLQHSARDVSEQFYLCADDELREAVDKMRVPVGFNSGPRMADRAAQAKAKEAEKIHLQPSDFDTPLGTDPKLWRFMDIGFEYRGKRYRMVGMSLQLLRKFVRSAGPVTSRKLQSSIAKPGWKNPQHQTGIAVSRLRNRLRVLMGLGAWDPLPCLGYGIEGRWQLHLPSWLNK